MSIPANTIVSVNPGVIDSGGNPLSLNGVFLTQSLLVPVDTPKAFTSLATVSGFFGPSSTEYTTAATYFLGYDNSFKKPGTIYFAAYAAVARAAWLQSGSLASMTLAQLQALSGTLIITVDGTLRTSLTINMATAVSFTDAATKITAGFSGSPILCTWNAVLSVFIITSVTTGATSTMTFATGTLSASLLFTSATGATISQGLAVDTPFTAMNRVTSATQNWVSFTTLWEPSIADKTLFAVWTNDQNQRYLYVQWDTDAQAIVQGSTTNFGKIAKTALYDAVASIYNTLKVASFVLGSIASIDFSRQNGRITEAFKHQAGLTATVTDENIAAILLENGYSFYGSYATANDNFVFLYNGQISGRWLWIDTYIGQIYINSQFQVALMSLLTSVGSIPYEEAGYGLIRAALADIIEAALNFGNIRSGVTLSQAQAAQVNSQAGLDVATIIEQTGWYLQILDPGSVVRGLRGTPIINFWYTDGGSVQQINMASIDIL